MTGPASHGSKVTFQSSPVSKDGRYFPVSMMSEQTALFQSSPVSKDGRYADAGASRTMTKTFQSSPVSKDGRYVLFKGLKMPDRKVSILARL